ncbi:MAG: FAD-linked oxidase C-terminal domain-containing protein [Planctomycetota bacterium]
MLAPLTEGDHGLLDIVVENLATLLAPAASGERVSPTKARCSPSTFLCPLQTVAVHPGRRAASHGQVPSARICDFGHWGDGGTHLNIVLPKDTSITAGDATWRELQSMVYGTCVRDFQGSYSAEHGVGPHNQPFYQEFTPQPVRTLCGVLRGHLDPGRLLGTVQLD